MFLYIGATIKEFYATKVVHHEKIDIKYPNYFVSLKLKGFS